LTNISCSRIAEELLAACLAGTPPEDLPPSLLDESCGHALFGVWVEGLADRFDPALCDVYARLFAQAAAHVDASLDAQELVARYHRIRQPRAITADPRRVYVLSRVTLGADVAVTSVLIAAARRRFPQAELFFAGPHKNYELFAGDSAIHHAPLEYRRGSLRERLATASELKQLFRDPDCLVIDPDSRLTQLGLLPVCPDDRYRFFESRAFGGASDRTLPQLAAAWSEQTFGISGATPFVCLKPWGRSQTCPSPYIAISLGVGENPAKRLPDPFEENLLTLLSATGHAIVIDAGAGGSEADRVHRALERSGVTATLWDGSFAGFASIIASSRLYVGYDSAGQHVAAACGVPLVTIFAGFPSARMFARWRPTGEQANVIRVDRPDSAAVLDQIRDVLETHV
jgi:ADP-heptose:LPS heptosyltransferase